MCQQTRRAALQSKLQLSARNSTKGQNRSGLLWHCAATKVQIRNNENSVCVMAGSLPALPRCVSGCCYPPCCGILAQPCAWLLAAPTPRSAAWGSAPPPPPPSAAPAPLALVSGVLSPEQRKDEGGYSSHTCRLGQEPAFWGRTAARF